MDDLALALLCADDADALTTQRFGALDLHVETKPDATPVSDADRAAEVLIRARVGEHRPDDAVLGEEQGLTPGTGTGHGTPARRWVLDPIDGTKNFIRGVPVWGSLIALEVDDEVTVGVVSAPALGRRWWAARGQGAWTSAYGSEPRRLQVSAVADLADAFFAYSSLEGWREHGRLDGFLDLGHSVWRTRAYGDFWSHMLVAEGGCDVSAEPEVSHWDIAALQVIVEEAGGRFTDIDGARTCDGASIICSNGLLHDEAVRRLAKG